MTGDPYSRLNENGVGRQMVYHLLVDKGDYPRYTPPWLIRRISVEQVRNGDVDEVLRN